MDGDAEVLGGGVEDATDVAFQAEPQRVAVGETRDEGLGDEQATAVARRDGRRVIEEGPRVEHRESVGVRVAQGSTVRSREAGKRLRELAAPRGVETLEKPPVPGRREGERLGVERVGAVAEQGAHGEVLIDHDHRFGPASVVLVGVGTAREDGVGVADLGQGVSELLGQVAGGDAAQDLATLGRETWVAGPATLPQLLEKILTDAHRAQCRGPRPPGQPPDFIGRRGAATPSAQPTATTAARPDRLNNDGIHQITTLTQWANRSEMRLSDPRRSWSSESTEPRPRELRQRHALHR